jgi:hypothetical protein
VVSLFAAAELPWKQFQNSMVDPESGRVALLRDLAAQQRRPTD